MILIDKEEALSAIVNEIRATHNEDTIYVGERVEEIGLIMAFTIIKHLPTIEERPLGAWMDATDAGIEMLECSKCGSRMIKRLYAQSVGTKGYNYCPYCGAAMIDGNNDA